MDTIFQVILIILLIFINGYFVASEMALVSIRKTRIDELVKNKNITAKLLQKSLKHIDKFISATQLGVTLVSLILGWIGEPFTANIVQSFLKFLPATVSTFTAHIIAVIIAFMIITYIDIVFGELVPKNIALQRTERISFITIKPLVLFSKLFQPFIVILTTSSNSILKLIGLSPTVQRQFIHSEDEIKIILSQSAQSGTIEKAEAEMVNKVFRIADLPVESIMVPCNEVVAFAVSAKLSTIVEALKHNSHSRFPIYSKTINDVIGFIHVKDVYKEAMQRKEDVALVHTAIVRKIIRVDRGTRVDDTIIEMRKRRIHLALVTDKREKTLSGGR